ncbi:SulP family inorganic anion transporter [Aquabacterium sp. OR-4]|uniref:SulP family inorganic anion transporter n=1 Tax=Aquabacterium sp. OR-4 TaxID=2978127 RepID=UPI0021B20BC2|nr:SulP family inorganic anion transporter [Aquabacterium sp. OR-4]MDT7836876.1 SulP family inorganic anion transporter [Aquabacterium sp. OR-4]
MPAPPLAPAAPALERWWPWLALLRQGGWRATLRADALAGLLGAVLVLPQGIAFAALAGLPPAMGLAAAVLPAAVAALAGSSRHVATGPTNATSLALGAMLAPLAQGDALLAIALAGVLTLLVGLMQALLALLRLGTLANFISPSVMLGFTSGAAALIAWHALAGLMGAAGRMAPPEAWARGVSLPALAVGLLVLGLAAAGRRWWRRGPHLLAALLVGGLAAWWLADATRRTALFGAVAAAPGSAGAGVGVGAGMGMGMGMGMGAGGPWLASAPLVVGTPPSAWPQWQWAGLQRALHWELLPQLLPMALALAIVALGQAMAVAKALAQRSGQVLDVNRECLGQGLGNLAGGLSGALVSCGSLNRSLPNYEAGARTPLASVAAALWLLVLLALAGPLLAWIPLAGVSALLLVVAWSLIDRAAWARLARLDRSELGIALATALATLVLRLEMAVLTGVMLSLVAYLWGVSRPALRSMGFGSQAAGRPFVVLDGAAPGSVLPECPQLKLLRMEGSVWFGAVAHVAEHLRALRSAPGAPRHLLVMAKSMNALDLAGADLWDDERQRRREMGGDLYFHRPRPPVLALWRRSGFLARLGEDHVYPDKQRAIARIVPRLDPAICAGCQVRLFDECGERPGAPIAPMI